MNLFEGHSVDTEVIWNIFVWNSFDCLKFFRLMFASQNQKERVTDLLKVVTTNSVTS